MKSEVLTDLLFVRTAQATAGVAVGGAFLLFPKIPARKRGAKPKARATPDQSTSVLPLPQPGVGDGPSHSPFKVRHHPVNALKSGCCLRFAQTTAPATGLRQLAAAFAAKPPMPSALVPGVASAPAMRERCVRACWASALLIPRSRACPCCHRCQR